MQSRNPGTRTSLVQDRDFGQTRTGVHRSLVQGYILTVGLTRLGIHGPKPIGLGPDKVEFKGDLGATRREFRTKRMMQKNSCSWRAVEGVMSYFQ